MSTYLARTSFSTVGFVSDHWGFSMATPKEPVMTGEVASNRHKALQVPFQAPFQLTPALIYSFQVSISFIDNGYMWIQGSSTPRLLSRTLQSLWQLSFGYDRCTVFFDESAALGTEITGKITSRSKISSEMTWGFETPTWWQVRSSERRWFRQGLLLGRRRPITRKPPPLMYSSIGFIRLTSTVSSSLCIRG